MASTQRIDKQCASHYLWGNGCDGWRLLTADSLAVIEERISPGESEVRHYHEKSRQFFYILSGMLSFEIEGRDLELAARQGIEIPPSVVHRVYNRSAQDVEFLLISSPPSHNDRIQCDKT